MSNQKNFNSDPIAVLYAESNHRISNNLTMIAGFLDQQARRVGERCAVDSEEACAILREASFRIAMAGELHRQLISNLDGTVDLAAYLTRIAQNALDTMAEPGDIDLVVDLKTCEVSGDTAIKLGIVVGELLVNAIKYAHPARFVPSRIEVGCDAREDGSLLVWVADDGVGLPEDFDPARDGGVGMRTLRLIARQANGALAFEGSDLGLTVRLSLPSEAVAREAA